jgi:uncharacterized NAD(P)/FAD-binding protein YdhS
MNILDAVKSRNFINVESALKAIAADKQSVNLWRDEEGRTPLMLAALYVTDANTSELIVKALLAAGSEVNAACFNHGNTALHYACSASNGAFIRALRKFSPAQVWPYVRNYKDRTPLDIANDQPEKLAPTMLADLDAIRFAKVGKGPVHLAVVGVGPAGTGMFIHLVQQLKDRALTPAEYGSIQISLFDKNAVMGTGTPYSRELNSDTSLLNVAAGGMSINRRVPNDFIYWLNNQQSTGGLEKALGLAGELDLREATAEGGGFYPRVTFGLYISQRLQEWVAFARELGLKVNVHASTEVKAQTPNGTEFQITYVTAGQQQQSVAVTHVFRSTGHWNDQKPAAQEPAYLSAKGCIKYPANTDTLIKEGVFNKGSNIAVLGSSLSAIDVIFAVLLNPKVGKLTWDDDDNPTYHVVTPGFKVTCYSRKGLFSKVRPLANEDVKLSYISQSAVARGMHWNGAPVKIDQLVSLLNMELTNQMQRPNSPVNAPPCNVLDEVSQFQKAQYKGKPKNPFVILADEVKEARIGDGRTIDQDYVRWYQVIHALLPTMHTAYRQFSPADRLEFDRDYNSNFLWAFAPMPERSARVLLELHNKGVLNLFRAQGGPVPGPNNTGVVVKALNYLDEPVSTTHDFMMVTTGLGVDARLDVSDYAQSVKQYLTFLDPIYKSSDTVDEGAAFTTDDGTFELMDKQGNHSSNYRAVGYLTHGNIWDIQAVPVVMQYGSQCAEVYAEEFVRHTNPNPKPLAPLPATQPAGTAAKL